MSQTHNTHGLRRGELTVEYLRSILHYDPITGIFTWKHRDDLRPCHASRLIGKVAGSACRTGPNSRYWVICVHYQRYYGQVLAWFYMKGVWPPEGFEVDHEDRDELNNRWENLRLATSSQNHANTGLRRRNKTGFKGVTFHRSTGRYRASVTVNGKHRHLGLFDDPADAHEAYKVAAAEAFGKFARDG